MSEVYIHVDLFSGCGGMMTGRVQALDELGIPHRGYAINHSPWAVATMRANHPDVTTLEMDLMAAVPAKVVPQWRIDHLHASPTCTHFSRAKGGRPRSEQLRSQPDIVFRWLDEHYVPSVSVENVPEFVDWGPLNSEGYPIASKKGACFRAWIAGLEARNYIVSWRVVNCADYGDATSRRRFFLKAVKRGSGKPNWPWPTHAENPQPDLFGHELKKWRGVRECLDRSDTGKSIFNREKPLAENTLRRIMVGLRKYNGLDFQMDMLGSDKGDGSRVRPLSAPLPPQHAGGNRSAVVRPFIVKLRHNENAEDVDAPLSTVTTSGAHQMLCQPLILDHCKNGEAKPPDAPMPAQTTHDRFSMITPLILDMSRPGGHDSGHIRPASRPIQTLTTCDNVQGVFPVLEDGRVIDIRIRMLKPEELAAAHSFPADYNITGNRSQKVRQIGNSVPVRTAKAMALADLQGTKWSRR